MGLYALHWESDNAKLLRILKMCRRHITCGAMFPPAPGSTTGNTRYAPVNASTEATQSRHPCGAQCARPACVGRASAAALRLVVPGDIRVVDFSGIAEIRAYTAYDPARSISAEVNAAVHRHLADNPLYQQRNAQATSISDLLTRQQWQRTSLYREAYAQVDQQDGLALDVNLGQGGMLTLNVTRASRGYTAAERMAMTLLGPHAQAQWRRLCQQQREQAAAQRSLSPASPAVDVLSAREREVLQWVAGGCTNAQIAKMLELSAGTIKRHLENIYRKLGAVDRRDALVRTRTH